MNKQLKLVSRKGGGNVALWVNSAPSGDSSQGGRAEQRNEDVGLPQFPGVFGIQPGPGFYVLVVPDRHAIAPARHQERAHPMLGGSNRRQRYRSGGRDMDKTSGKLVHGSVQGLSRSTVRRSPGVASCGAGSTSATPRLHSGTSSMFG